MGADFNGLSHALAVGESHGSARTEGIARSRGVAHKHGLRGAVALFAVNICVNRALRAHGDYHGGDFRVHYLLRKKVAHLLGALVGKVVNKQYSRLLHVADEAVYALEEIAPLGCDAHVCDHGVDGLAVLLGVLECPCRCRFQG